ncbi:MAG TPA: gamma-glutamyltransferase [Stellaceae bacterium]|nr:gamma-glutamyltransferase [Stellaceae bacterium]
MIPTQNWDVRKPAARSRRGVVASQNGKAAEIGAAALAEGGNAVDAVLAAAFGLAAVEPWNSGLGGIGFMVVQLPQMGHAECVDFGPVAPRRLDPKAFPLTGGVASELFTWPQVEGDRNMKGPLSFATPSAVAGYALAAERFGRLPWRRLVEPAAALAREGREVDWWLTVKTAYAASDLRRYEESRRVWLADGLPPCAPADGGGPRLVLGRLPETLARLAEQGAEDFYTGEIARSIAADVAAAGGVLSADDLAQCRARIVPALDIAYRGLGFAAAPGLTAGPSLETALGILSGRQFSGAPDALYFAAVVEALQRAYAERLAGFGDSEADGTTSTTHVTAADSEGGIAALTTTLLSSFGSRYVLPGTGILMNNGIMWFDPRPGRPNSIGPGKRALNNMCPLVVARDGRPWFGIGASGGRRILGAVMQVASFIVDFAMTPEEAAHHPRVDVSGGERVAVDARMPATIREALAAHSGAGIAEHAAWPALFACPNLVLRGPDGVNCGVSDVMSPNSAAVAEAEGGRSGG